MKEQILIIHWDDETTTGEKTSVFKNIKTLKSAKKIVLKRNIRNIKKALYYENNGSKPIKIDLPNVNVGSIAVKK